MKDVRDAGRVACEDGRPRDPFADGQFLISIPEGTPNRDRVTLAHGWLDGWDLGWSEYHYGPGTRVPRPASSGDLPHPGLLDPVSAFWVMDLFRQTHDRLRGRIIEHYLERDGDFDRSRITGREARAGIPSQGMLWTELREVAARLFAAPGAQPPR